MANFELAEGEQIVFQFECSLIDGGKSLPARLIITNQRIVNCVGAKSSLVGALLGKWMERPFISMIATRISHEIARDRFASVELEDGVVVFRDDGEGYGQTSFAITSNVLGTKDGLATLQGHLRT
jgi:hypothetical protein